MFHLLFLLPLADLKSLQAPVPSDPAGPTLGLGLALGLLVLGLLLFGLRRTVRRAATPARPANWILVDGSNVMHWQDNTPRLAPLLRVIEDLKARGFAPGVVFDANAGHKLFGRYLNERELARMLALPKDQLLVVPKGTPADPYILDTARKFKVPIVTNDAYRDWAADYPEVAKPGVLIWGGFKEGKLWLRYPDLTPDTAQARMAEPVA